MNKVAFIGLGTMGYPIAGHLARAGLEVTVFNRTVKKAEQWLSEYGGHHAASPAQAARNAHIVFSCVGNDEDVRAITSGDTGAFVGMNKGAIFVDHTTTSAELALEMAEQAEVHELGFIDAPVSGGQSGAESGVLTVMCGGREEVFEKVSPVISHYARACELMGPSGSGQLTKMVNQTCIAGLLQGLAEGLNFGTRAGLDMEKVVTVISQGAAQSWQMDNRATTMLADEFDFGFAVDWMCKDLGIVLDLARKNGAPLPVTKQVLGYYRELQSRGDNRLDTSSLIRLLRAEA